MAIVKPFTCIRPECSVVSKVAALPYDVYNRKEACQVTASNPLSFLNIDRAETQFPEDVDMYAPQVYHKARQLLDAWVADGTFVTDKGDNYYLYQLTMDGRSQTGIVACCSIDDYETGVIKKHENTREDKELDRIRHVDVTDAHTGPIFLAYRSNEALARITGQVMGNTPLYDFVSEDGIGHRVWRIGDPRTVQAIEEGFKAIPATYIADGHHRAASAVKVGLKRRQENPGYTGREPFNYFLSVLFPEEQLFIMPYNRVVKDLNGLTMEEFLGKVSEKFDVLLLEKVRKPEKKGQIIMYLHGYWFRLTIKDAFMRQDPVEGMDVAYLQRELLEPVLGINDPKTDERVDFVGGIRGMEELKRRADEDMEVAFAMYPTSIQELFEVADAGLLMPPKSTWFEPKLRSGLFIHEI